jgi:fructan beta-fructosidase
LAGLRQAEMGISRRAVRLDGNIFLGQMAGPALDIQAEFHLAQARKVGLRLLKCEQEWIEIGWNQETGTLCLDRSHSGKTDFHPAFADQAQPIQAHASPAPGQRLKLRVLADHSTVEVFAGNGETAISSLIFPRQNSAALEAYAEGGEAELCAFAACQMKSAFAQ